MTIRTTVLFALLCGCTAEGGWTLNTWGEDYIEEAIPPDAFVDDCAAAYDTFQVVLSEEGLVDGNGVFVATVAGAQVFDVHLPGPHLVGSVPAPVGLYPTVQARIAPHADPELGNVDPEQASAILDNGWSIYVEGSVRCGLDSVRLAWGFDTDTTYVCEPEGLEVPRGGAGLSELTIHGDHLFYDGLEDPDARLQGLAIVAADADGDGWVTLAELEAVDVAPLGYTVGRFGEVRDLRQFVTHLTTTLGHIDGEGHCTTLRAE